MKGFSKGEKGKGSDGLIFATHSLTHSLTSLYKNLKNFVGGGVPGTSGTPFFGWSKKKLLVLSFVFIALINLLVYYPSFSHVASGDHIGFIYENAPNNDLYSLIIKNVSYNRTRTYGAGDYFLFRPVFSSLLGAEKWLFGYNFSGFMASRTSGRWDNDIFAGSK